ncbi:MAG: hypothetical protein JSV62_10470 [Promethearchaeota archaeon]|nr:MAG: hypothetical protein JSV62_10470 [Candidatus Lokiarchaeota archaeon]
MESLNETELKELRKRKIKIYLIAATVIAVIATIITLVIIYSVLSAGTGT